MVNIGMNRCENGQIYKTTDIGYNKFYVGSTCENLSKRIERHRKHFREYTRGKTRKKTTAIDISKEYGIENCKIELVENCQCNSREELTKREGQLYKSDQVCK